MPSRRRLSISARRDNAHIETFKRQCIFEAGCNQRLVARRAMENAVTVFLAACFQGVTKRCQQNRRHTETASQLTVQLTGQARMRQLKTSLFATADRA